MRLAHISDPHFGTERPEVLAALLRTLADLRPAVVILSGDVTQRAFRSQFAAARRFVEALPPGAHCVVIPGNHDLPLWDLWRRFTAPYALHESALGPRESLWRGHGVVVLAVDATHPRRRKDGHLPPARLQGRLAEARALRGAGDLLLVVVHQPLWTAWGEDKRQTLIDRHETAGLLAAARTDVMLTGHVHVPLLATSAASDPDLAWRFVLCGAGTAVSHRTRPAAPNSFNVLELEAAAADLRIARHDWNGASFGVKETVAFHRHALTGWERAPLPG